MTDGTSTKTVNDLAGERTDLAIERTVMAANRTSMAWVRTGTSLISFGFTIYKVMQAAIGDTEVGLLKVAGPRRLGLLLIALGTASIICARVGQKWTFKFDKLNKWHTAEDAFDFWAIQLKTRLASERAAKLSPR